MGQSQAGTVGVMVCHFQSNRNIVSSLQLLYNYIRTRVHSSEQSTLHALLTLFRILSLYTRRFLIFELAYWGVAGYVMPTLLQLRVYGLTPSLAVVLENAAVFVRRKVALFMKKDERNSKIGALMTIASLFKYILSC